MLPETLGRLANLVELRLYHNGLTSLPESLGGLAQLRELHAKDNTLQTLPSSVGGLAELRKLDLEDNRISALPDALGSVSCRELLANIAHDLESAGARRGSERWREEIVAKAACRVAAGAETALSDEEAARLVAALAVPVNACPTRRPTRQYGRSVQLLETSPGG